MRILNQQTALEPIDAVTPHPKNPRRGDTEAIQASVQELGFYGVVIAQRSTGHILAGNHRYLAAQAAGAREIPVTWLDVTDEQARRILLADNRTSDLGGYDTTALADLLASLPESALTGTGYDASDAASLLAAAHPYTPPPMSTPTPPATEPATRRDATPIDTRLVMCPNCGHEFHTDA